MDVASAFDAVSAQVLGDVLLERGATAISAAAAVRENFGTSSTAVLGVRKNCFVQFGRGHETGSFKNTFSLEPGHGGADRGIIAIVGGSGTGGVLGSRMDAV